MGWLWHLNDISVHFFSKLHDWISQAERDLFPVELISLSKGPEGWREFTKIAVTISYYNFQELRGCLKLPSEKLSQHMSKVHVFWTLRGTSGGRTGGRVPQPFHKTLLPTKYKAAANEMCCKCWLGRTSTLEMPSKCFENTKIAKGCILSKYPQPREKHFENHKHVQKMYLGNGHITCALRLTQFIVLFIPSQWLIHDTYISH